MNKICFIAQFPPPVHGLSKAVDTLYGSKLSENYELEKIDITSNKKFLSNIKLLIKSKADMYYLTISQTKGGNIRDLIFMALIRRKKAKCIIHLHGGYYRNLYDNDMGVVQKKANRKALSNIEGAIVLGESLKYIFKDLVDTDKIFVVPNCVDWQYLISDEEMKQKDKDICRKNVHDVLYLSNFIKSKGYEDVIKLACLEKARVEAGGEKRLHFHMAGKFFEQKEENEYLNSLEELKLSEYVTYYGSVYGTEKKELLQLSDIFVLLTRYPKEGQPISILEAMGNGMMIVTTNHAGIPDIADNNSGVIAIESMSVEEVYNQILKLDDKIQQIADYNRKKVLMCYTEDKYVDNCINVFKKVLES